MDKIDAGKVEVLRVPAEESFPTANVAIGRVDALYFVAQRVGQEGVEVVEVPAFGGGVHEGAEEVGAVEGSGEGDVFPELYYYYKYHLFDLVCG